MSRTVSTRGSNLDAIYCVRWVSFRCNSTLHEYLKDEKAEKLKKQEIEEQSLKVMVDSIKNYLLITGESRMIGWDLAHDDFNKIIDFVKDMALSEYKKERDRNRTDEWSQIEKYCNSFAWQQDPLVLHAVGLYDENKGNYFIVENESYVEDEPSHIAVKKSNE